MATAKKTPAKVAPKQVKPVEKAAPVVAKQTTAQKLDVIGIESICEQIADCNSIQVIANGAGVSKGSLIVWLTAFPDQYMRAREAQAEKFAEDIIGISDETEVEAKYDGDDVRLDLSATAVARNRLRVDSRKWLASKMYPKRFGDKLTSEITGPNGGPIDLSLSVSFIKPK